MTLTRLALIRHLITFSELCKVTNAMLQSLATEEGIREVILLYHDFYASIDSQPEMIEPEPAHDIKFATHAKGAACGCDFESTLSPESLASNLGFKDGLPLPFNKYRHKGGLTPRDPKFQALFFANPSLFDLIALHWHQLAGLHAIVRKLFTAEPQPDHCRGILLADEVGLGKTYLLAAFIAFLVTLLNREPTFPLPPIIGIHSVSTST